MEGEAQQEVRGFAAGQTWMGDAIKRADHEVVELVRRIYHARRDGADDTALHSGFFDLVRMRASLPDLLPTYAGPYGLGFVDGATSAFAAQDA